MRKILAPLFVCLLLGGGYLWTMAPGNFWLDSPAFAACNQILGLPHSPSFPLYTILGRTLNVSLPGAPVSASNFYSMLAAVCGGVVCCFILLHLLGDGQSSFGFARIFAVAGALYIGFMTPVWQSAVRAEVYALQIVLMLLIMYFFFKMRIHSEDSRQVRFAVIMVFLQGLAFANHSLMALATLPLVLIATYRIWRTESAKTFVKTAVASAIVFAVALSCYLYLPIRAEQNPAINSGRPTTLATTFQAITRTGEDYLPPAAQTSPAYISRAAAMGKFIFEQTGGLILIGLAMAVFFAVRERRRAILILLLISGLGFGITLWAADFSLSNFDIVAYSSTGLIPLTLCAFYGIYRIILHFKDRRRIDLVAYAVGGLLVFFQFSGNLYSSDLAGTRGPDRLAGIILDTAPPDAVLIVNEDDVLLPLWYHCYALGKRPDVAVISTGALYRPSYREEVRHLYPDLNFPAEMNTHKIDDLGHALAAFCRMNDDRPIMVQFGTPGIGVEKLRFDGFLFQYADSGAVPFDTAGKQVLVLLDSISSGATDLLTKEFAARTAFNFGVYFDRVGDQKSAYKLFQYAVETDNTNPDYLLRLGVAFYKAGKNTEAIMLLDQATKTGDGCPEAETIIRQIREKEYSKR